VATTPKPKVLDFAASVDRRGRMSAESCPPVDLPDEWTPEHLVLAALGRCSLASLKYHARRAGVEATGDAAASGRITRRDEDGRFAFVEVECRLDVDLAPEPAGPELAALIAKAERDCFISASICPQTAYRWRVNGRDL
jgi:organic hydroperoxide reductase OsmC/OhrA